MGRRTETPGEVQKVEEERPLRVDSLSAQVSAEERKHHAPALVGAGGWRCPPTPGDGGVELGLKLCCGIVPDMGGIVDVDMDNKLKLTS